MGARARVHTQTCQTSRLTLKTDASCLVESSLSREVIWNRETPHGEEIWQESILVPLSSFSPKAAYGAASCWGPRHPCPPACSWVVDRGYLEANNTSHCEVVNGPFGSLTSPSCIRAAWISPLRLPGRALPRSHHSQRTSSSGPFLVGVLRGAKLSLQ